MECQVELDYTAQEPEELTIKRGEIITNVVTEMEGWYEGTLRGKRGVFPCYFVKIVNTYSNEQDSIEEPLVTVMPPGRKLRVLIPYSSEMDNQLNLKVGDVVHFIEEFEPGWWKGKLNGRVGVFPSNFVEELKEERSNENEEVEFARCIYSYQAVKEDELSLMEGDIVTIISKEWADSIGMWLGERRGKLGFFPLNFVKKFIPDKSDSQIRGVSNSNTNETQSSLASIEAPATAPLLHLLDDSTNGEDEEDGPQRICEICFASFAELKKRGFHIVTTPCGHIYCRECILGALEHKPECPNCRNAVRANSLVRLFM